MFKVSVAGMLHCRQLKKHLAQTQGRPQTKDRKEKQENGHGPTQHSQESNTLLTFKKTGKKSGKHLHKHVRRHLKKGIHSYTMSQ